MPELAVVSELAVVPELAVVSELAVAVRAVSRSYGPVRAVTDVTLEVPRGQTVAVLGPNGAGKTTTIGMTVGLVQPDRGTVRAVSTVGSRFVVESTDADATVRALVTGSLPWRDLAIAPPSLDEPFLALTQTQEGLV